MRIKFLGAASTVTGSFYVIDTEKVRFALDCGMFQGAKAIAERNYGAFSVEPKSIEFLILSHAHIDHSGLIPKLCKAGFKGPIYCSSVTEELCQVMLPDSAHIQEFEVKRKNRKLSRIDKVPLEPIYTIQDALNSLYQFVSLNYDEVHEVAEGVELRLRDAGHILGSCITELWIEEGEDKTKLVYSGDIGHGDQPFVKNPTVIEEADYLLIESTYGNRKHQEMTDRSERLKQIIDDTMNRGGNLIIPSFAVERTQDLLYDLSILHSQGRLDPSIAVYIDSPLAIAATEIFEHNQALYDQKTIDMVKNGFHPLKSPYLKFSRTQEDSMRLNKITGNAIIISASGMCEAGRIKHHLKYNLWRPECTILFVGYQAEGTLGRRILDGEKMVTIHGEQVIVKARIENIQAYSAHADQTALMDWLGNFSSKLKTVFIVHGEEKAQKVFAELIENELHIPTDIPTWLEEVALKQIEVVQPIQIISGTQEAKLPSHDWSEALAAEEIYLRVRGKLNQLFEARYDNAQYEKLIEELKELEYQLNNSYS
ncbi:MAG: MBL fold metallo-hydrolase [Desulfitobacteriaceae bacterium]|nr:MBL fold metallo-hydrolase [Desulfitobacteriaceae bacterium]MDD4345674.1 MBL fold metallo-hydrolase [Desulfitobacteriaceae bacterium]MDD4400514.1 MBL fold metallo-hydrolase [Desulfitobacteriaceae bacterium]